MSGRGSWQTNCQLFSVTNLGHEARETMDAGHLNTEIVAVSRRAKYSAHIWKAVRFNRKRCINWTMAVGVMSMVTLSAATWLGVATVVSKLVH